jgi:hypothetical protein
MENPSKNDRGAAVAAPRISRGSLDLSEGEKFDMGDGDPLYLDKLIISST